MYGIWMVATKDGSFTFNPGVWLKHYDPDGNDGDGSCDFTSDPDEATTFADEVEAAAFFLLVSTVRPVIAGRFNRPLYDQYRVQFRELP